MNGRRSPGDTDRMVSLKVDNLTYRTRAEDLQDAFERYGEIGDVYIPRDPYSKDSLGYAFVRYFDRRDAMDALESMDGATIHGRQIKVQMARYGRRRGPIASRGSRYRHSRSPHQSGRYERRSRSRRRSSHSAHGYNHSSRHQAGYDEYRDQEAPCENKRFERSRSFSNGSQNSRRDKPYDPNRGDNHAELNNEARAHRSAGNESRSGSIVDNRRESSRCSSVVLDNSNNNQD